MNLDYTEEQNILGDMVRSLCDKFCSTKLVRDMEDDPVGVSPEFWEQLKQTGILGILLPDEYGGMGLDMLDCAIIYEELGRGLAPGPHFDSTVMTVNAISKAGTKAQKEKLLPTLAEGELIITPAWLEPDNDFEADGVQLKAQECDGGYTLTGIKRHVFYAGAADQLLVLARTGASEDAIDLFLVDVGAKGLALEQQRSMASDTQYKVTFDNVYVSVEQRVGPSQSGWGTWQSCMYEGAILQAALAVGGAERSLEITVQYSKEREQFGKPIGSFQSLAHYMADASAAIAGAKVLVHEAAWACNEGKSIRRLAPMAKLAACKTFRDSVAKCVQIHGGYGFTLDYDIQLFFRRAKQQQLNWWDSAHLERLIATDVLDSDYPRTVEDPFTV